MLKNLRALEGYSLRAMDGEIGVVEDFYFDDQHWGLRYLVVATGGWLTGRNVLISPLSVRKVDWNDKIIEVKLTRKQVENSPDIDTHIAQLMSAGEFPVAIVYAHRIESMKKKGAPVEWVNTVDPVVVSTNGIAISAKPKHPNAAKLFIDFALSKEGQNIIRNENRIPARSDVDPLSPKMDQAKLNFEVVPEDMSTRLKEYVEGFRKIFNLS